MVVLDNGGRENATVWGDILTWVAHKRGIAGTVIDGACRDTHLSRELGYPVYSRSYSMRTGKDRVQVEAMNGPVNIGDARVEPGDLLRGDADGVVVASSLRNTNAPGAPDIAFGYGAARYTPVTGDWDGNGATGVGVID